jgi:hypothetical protein
MSQIPEIVFIIPYRNRPYQKYFFVNYMQTILENTSLKYEIYFSHQCDIRSFNRGSVKNIGFIAIKNKYPNDYQNITFVFNDIDTIPFSNILNYKTNNGIVKHFYGFTYALGGIVSITGHDIEITNGYPNFWGWGMEDNVLQKRCEQHNIKIDRSQFYKIGSPEILHLFDGVSRIINRKDPWRATHDNGIDGIKTIHQLKYSIDTDSKNPNDNKFIPHLITNKIFFINIDTFLTAIRFESDNYHSYDIREPPRKIINPNFVSLQKENTKIITDDWTNIPFYPSIDNRKSMIKEYGKENAEKIIEYSYNNTTDPTNYVIPPDMNNNNNNNKQKLTIALLNLYKIKKQKLLMQQQQQQQQNSIKHKNIIHNKKPFIEKNKKQATASVNIKLGGVY